MRKLFFIFFAILLFTQNSFAGTGTADIYKITIRQIAMCETGSTLSNCLNPVVIFTGNSADIDIICISDTSHMKETQSDLKVATVN